MSKNSTIKPIKDAAPDLVEPILDEVTSNIMKDVFGIIVPELVKDLPILKYAKTGADVYSAIRLSRLSKRMKAFASAINAGQFKIDDFKKLSNEEQHMAIDTVVTELDNHTDDLQSEALGYLFTAYISGEINRLFFTGISHELKNTNPLVFYFKIDNYEVTDRDRFRPALTQELGFAFASHKYGTTIDSGPVHYLPPAFKSNSSSTMKFATEDILTDLGEAFFGYVYNPMKQSHLSESANKDLI